MAKKKTRPPGQGRPPTGEGGARISKDYHSVRLRVPPDMRVALNIASGVLSRPQWKVMVDAFFAYIGDGEPLAADQRKVIQEARRVHRK